MEKGIMKELAVKTNPNESMDIEVNKVPIVNLTRGEVDELYFQLGAAMLDQDMMWVEAG